ncbi:MAG: nucleoside deaminase [Bacteroidales bacterium]|nr:nucleoside deaminase [Bacteroidales bacterium]
MEEMTIDERFMREALREAKEADAEGEVPVGAVIVCKDRVIARGHNMTEALHDPTAHAEMIAITAATEAFEGKYLNDCTLYVTLEPCTMCAGALSWAQIGRIVYGADDPKRGCSLFSPSLLHPKTEVLGGVLAEECSALVTEFFRRQR